MGQVSAPLGHHKCHHISVKCGVPSTRAVTGHPDNGFKLRANMEPRKMAGNRYLLWALNIIFLALPFSSLTWAGQPETVAMILSNAPSFQLHSVTLQGTVRHVEKVGEYINPDCGYVYDTYTFTLDDGTGLVHVVVPGPCGTRWMPKEIVSPVSDGDRVEIEAHINVLADNEMRPAVQAVAKQIRRLDE